MDPVTEPTAKPFDPKRHARMLYWIGWDVTQIAAETGIPRTTVQSWKQRDKWDEASPVEQSQSCLSTRFNMLVMKDQKTGQDFKEIDLLGRQMSALARVRRYEGDGGHEGDLNEKVANRNKGEKKKPRKNLIDCEALAILKASFLRDKIEYQETWWDSSSLRTRMLLKSRQIGATFDFARERLIRALETGNNQIFISASRNQANVFRQYIQQFVQKELRITLTGDPIIIDRGDDEDGNPLEPVELHFLGTNYRTAQSYHGDVIIDEFFWIYGFAQLYKVASNMAAHKRYTKTLFSTPSTINHEAYPMWSGERFNRRRPKDKRVKIDISHKALKDGHVGADGIWRQIVTLEDAIEKGCEFFDHEEIKLEHSIDEYDNLFRCQFIDDAKSSFPLSLIQPCMVEAFDRWRDFDPYALKPYAGEVWLGYDPSESEDGDNASLVAIAAPESDKGKFRVLEKVQMRGLDFQGQADKIKEFTRKYRVTEIAIDKRGVGAAVYQLVRKFFPLVRGLDYSPSVKGQMVLKAQNVFRNRRIEIDLGWVDLAAALMSIHPQMTKGGHMLTYVARRSAETGHGDLGWALLHALYCEPLEGATDNNKSTVEFFG